MAKQFKLTNNKKIMIKGAEYTIKLRKKVMLGKQECWGLHDSEKKLITIQKGLPKGETLPVFLHELFHAYIFECNIREGLDSSLEEIIVECLAHCIDQEFELEWK